MYRIIVFLILFVFSFKVFSQRTSRDSCTNIFSVSAAYGYFIPGGDLKDRFGNNSTIGAALLYKTSKNLLFGADWNYIFGNKIKENNLFSNISTSKGFIIDGNGYPAIVSLYERGFITSLKFGKVFALNSFHPNSGLVFLASVGLMQHKIYIYNMDGAAYQIKDDYKKGYDKLTNGLSVSEYAGYIFHGKNNLLNFYAGFEFTQAWTQNRRSYNFDTRSKDNTKRLDMLFGAKIGWMIPFYSRKTKKIYYY